MGNLLQLPLDLVLMLLQLALWEKAPAVTCIPIQDSWFGLPAQTNQALHPYGIDNLVSDFPRRDIDRSLQWSNTHSKGRSRYSVEVECVAHPAKGLSNADLYHLSFVLMFVPDLKLKSSEELMSYPFLYNSCLLLEAINATLH